jgi:hypothetical protein
VEARVVLTTTGWSRSTPRRGSADGKFYRSPGTIGNCPARAQPARQAWRCLSGATAGRMGGL